MNALRIENSMELCCQSLSKSKDKRRTRDNMITRLFDEKKFPPIIFRSHIYRCGEIKAHIIANIYRRKFDENCGSRDSSGAVE